MTSAVSARLAWMSSPSAVASALISAEQAHQSMAPTRSSGWCSRRTSVAMPIVDVLPRWALTNSSRRSPDIAAHQAYCLITAAISSGVRHSVPGSSVPCPYETPTGMAGRTRHPVRAEASSQIAWATRVSVPDGQVRAVLLGRADRHQPDRVALGGRHCRAEVRPGEVGPPVGLLGLHTTQRGPVDVRGGSRPLPGG